MKQEDMAKNFGEQMHLMGQIQALLKLKLEITKQHQKLEAQLDKLRAKKTR